MIKRLLLIVILLALPLASAQAQMEVRTLIFAAVTAEGLQYFEVGDYMAPTTGTAQYTRYSSLTWNADGSILAFMGHDAEYVPALVIIDRPTQTFTELVKPVYYGSPVSFTADGQILYAASSGEFVTTDGPGGEVMNVFTIAPTPSAAPIQIGSYTLGVGCGGGSSLPADWAYWTESEGGPGIARPTLALTPFGLLHSQNCTGVGTALLDLTTNTDTPLGSGLAWAVVSPDGSRVAGIGYGSSWTDAATATLVMVDLATKAITIVGSAPDVTQVIWGSSTSLIYSTRTDTGQAIPTTPDEQQKVGDALGYMAPTALPLFSVALHHLDLSTGTDTVVYTAPAYAIGRMSVSSDGSMLLFSQVPNVDAMVAAILGGTTELTPALAPVEAQMLSLAQPDQLPTGLGYLNQVTINPAM
jgi:hypothetical protein